MAQQPNMNQMLKQVQKMQADMAAAQEQLAKETVQASAGGGMVTVTVSGDLDVKDIRICLLYTSPSPRDRTRSRMPSSA